jgi:flagellar biosynthesis regulator FlaF
MNKKKVMLLTEANERLRGQLQNCINHLHGARRTSNSDQIDKAIEAANKALYETKEE